MAVEIPKSAIELGKRLKKIHDNKAFVLGVVDVTKTDEDREKLIEFIDRGENVNITSVSEMAYHLRCERDGIPKYQFKHYMDES